MSEEVVNAIVLGGIDLGESDRLVHLLTRERGRIAARARGARKSRKRYGGRLERYALVRARLHVRKGRSSLGEVDLLRPFLGLREELIRTAMADHLLELVRTVAREEEPIPDLFGLLLQALAALDGGATPSEAWVRAASMRVMELSGVGLSVQRCCGCGRPPGPGAAGFSVAAGGVLCGDHVGDDPGARQLALRDLTTLQRLATLDLAETARTGLTDADVRRVRGLLERFVEYHLERRARTGAFLDALLDGD